MRKEQTEKAPRFDDPHDETWLHLLCPTCADPYTHHGDVTVYNRDHEDGDATAVTVRNGTATMGRVPDAELPGRRGSVEIYLICENCASESKLRIIQRKGGTFLSTLETGREVAHEDIPFFE